MKQFTGSDWLESQIALHGKRIEEIDRTLTQIQSTGWKGWIMRLFVLIGIVGVILGIWELRVGGYLMFVIIVPVSAIGTILSYFFDMSMSFSMSDATTRLPFIPEDEQMIAWSVIGLIAWMSFFVLPIVSAYRLVKRRRTRKVKQESLTTERAKYATKLKNAVTGKSGEDLLPSMLDEFLDDDWILYRNVGLELMDGSKADIDAVLVGEQGIFVIEVKNYTTAHRLTGTLWERQQRDGWVREANNPATQLLKNTTRVAEYLQLCNVNLPVFPRLAWVGSGQFFVQNQPAILVWFPNRIDFIKSDIRGKSPNLEWQVNNAHNALRNRMIAK